jgi:hypothetical protein
MDQVSEDRLHQKANACSRPSSRWSAPGDKRGQSGHQVVNGAGCGRRRRDPAVVSYEHASALVRRTASRAGLGRLIPLTVDGSHLREFDGDAGRAQRAVGVPAQARQLLDLGIVAMLATNVAHGLIGAAVGAWPATAFVGSY